MRVTTSMMVSGTFRDLSQAMTRLQTTQSQLSSGKQLTKASDDPAAATNAMTLRKQLNLADQRSRSLDDASGWLGQADSTLNSSLDLVSQAKDIAVRAANTGGLSDPNARLAMATQIRSIRTDLLSQANATYNGRSIFGGTVPGPAYDANTGQFLGNAASVVRDIAPQTNLAVNVSGPQAFGSSSAPAGSIFDVLDRLATAVANGDDTAMATEHANLDTAFQTMGAAEVDIGSRGARLDGIKSRADDAKLRLTTQLSGIEDIDPATALVTEKAQENSYTAALQAASKVLPPSLLDYLH